MTELIIADGRVKGVRVIDVLHALASETLEDVAARYRLEREDIEACLAFAVAAIQQQQ